MGKLAGDLSQDEAVVIFPEGTRFSQAKLEQLLTLSQFQAPERVASARRLHSVLPVRTPGLLAILNNAVTTDLVLLNHVGVTDFRNLRPMGKYSLPCAATFQRKRINEV